MLMKLICSEVSSNQSSPAHEYPECRGEGAADASLLVSPLVVAGIVIGLVLFLSCVTIIVGSLRKDGRLRSSHLHVSYAPDGYSYGGSIGELRSTCIEDYPPVFDFDSYVETLSQANVMYPDAPPQYEECVGPATAPTYIPSEDPPPYSLTDPCQTLPSQSSQCHWDLPEGEQPVASVSMPMEAAPPYETLADQPLPLIPAEVPKLTNRAETQLDRTATWR